MAADGGAETAAAEEMLRDMGGSEGELEEGEDDDGEESEGSSGDGEDEEKENEAEIQRLEEQVRGAGGAASQGKSRPVSPQIGWSPPWVLHGNWKAFARTARPAFLQGVRLLLLCLCVSS